MERVRGVTLVWDHDYFDGPVSGLARYRGEEYWFAAVWNSDTDDWTHPRRYVLKPLSSEELEDEWNRHRTFERFVGTRWCHHLGAAAGDQRPDTEWHRFYDAFPEAHPDYEDRAAVAWFYLDE